MEGITAGLERTVALGHRHIAEQEDCIARQQALVEELTRRGHDDRAAAAKQTLSDMRLALSQMRHDLCSAQQRLRECTQRVVTDDPDADTMMDKVTRDCPL